MSQAERKPTGVRHFQRGLVADSDFGTDLEHQSVSGAIVAVAILSIFTAFAGPAIAQELPVCQSNISASDPTPQQCARAKPAGAVGPLTRGASEVAPSAFDVTALPSLDSIDKHTDITVFLQTGVPAELRLAALRRAWTVDPVIRDFKELQENDWKIAIGSQNRGDDPPSNEVVS